MGKNNCSFRAFFLAGLLFVFGVGASGFALAQVTFGLSYGAWSSTTKYTPGSVVVYDDFFYFALLKCAGIHQP